jgi:hypothetical protein
MHVLILRESECGMEVNTRTPDSVTCSHTYTHTAHCIEGGCR